MAMSPRPVQVQADHLIIDGPYKLTFADDSLSIDPAAGPNLSYLRLVEKTVWRATASRDGASVSNPQTATS